MYPKIIIAIQRMLDLGFENRNMNKAKEYMLANINNHGEIGVVDSDIWYVDDLEFGRSPFDILCDWYGRLRYAIASMGEAGIDEITAACKRHLKGFDHFKLPQDRYGDGENYYGYIDHQSLICFAIRCTPTTSLWKILFLTINISLSSTGLNTMFFAVCARRFCLMIL